FSRDWSSDVCSSDLERATFKVAHDDVGRIIRSIIIKDGQQMGMFEAGDQTRFTLKTLQRRRIGCDGSMNHLHGDESTNAGLKGAENRRHPAFADFLYNFIGTEPSTNHVSALSGANLRCDRL